MFLNVQYILYELALRVKMGPNGLWDGLIRLTYGSIVPFCVFVCITASESARWDLAPAAWMLCSTVLQLRGYWSDWNLRQVKHK